MNLICAQRIFRESRRWRQPKGKTIENEENPTKTGKPVKIEGMPKKSGKPMQMTEFTQNQYTWHKINVYSNEAKLAENEWKPAEEDEGKPMENAAKVNPKPTLTASNETICIQTRFVPQSILLFVQPTALHVKMASNAGLCDRWFWFLLLAIGTWLANSGLHWIFTEHLQLLHFSHEGDRTH